MGHGYAVVKLTLRMMLIGWARLMGQRPKLVARVMETVKNNFVLGISKLG